MRQSQVTALRDRGEFRNGLPVGCSRAITTKGTKVHEEKRVLFTFVGCRRSVGEGA